MEAPRKTLHSIKNRLTPSSRKSPSSSSEDWSALVAKLTFASDAYTYDHVFSPGIAFYKFLAKRPKRKDQPRLCLNVPSTLVLNDSMVPVWVYTGNDGCVYRTEAFNFQQVAKGFDPGTPQEVCAVLKRPKWSSSLKRCAGLTTTVLTFNGLVSRYEDFVQSQPCALQQFVRCRGPVPFVCRTVFRKHERSVAYVISSRFSYWSEDLAQPCLTDLSKKSNCSVVTATNGSLLNNTLPPLRNLVEFLETELGVCFLELAADFVRDQNNQWWFLTCKAFKLAPGSSPVLKGFIVDKPYVSSDSEAEEDQLQLPAERKRLKKCRSCRVPLPIPALAHQLSIKMISDIDEALKHRGIDLPWLKQTDQPGAATFYQCHKVCQDCYELYEAVSELQEVEAVFKSVFNVPQAPVEPVRDEYKLNSEVAVAIYNHRPKVGGVVKKMKAFRMLISIADLQELRDVCVTKLEFKYLTATQSYSFSQRAATKVAVLQNKVIHFFAYNWDEVQDYLKENHQLPFQLDCGTGQSIRFSLDLIEFCNPIVRQKHYFQPILRDGRTLGYLNCNVAIEWSQEMNVSTLPLTSFNGLYLPPPDFYLCAPLTKEWFDLLPSIPCAGRTPHRASSLVMSDYEKIQSLSGVRLKMTGQLSWTVSIQPANARPSRFHISVPSQQSNGADRADQPLLVSPVANSPYARNKAKRSLHRLSRNCSLYEAIVELQQDVTATVMSHSFDKSAQKPLFIRRTRSQLKSRNFSGQYQTTECSGQTTGRSQGTPKSSLKARLTYRLMWALEITLLSAYSLPAVDEGRWRASFEIFSEIFGGNAVAQHNNSCSFNLSKSLLFKATKTSIFKLCRETELEIRVYNDVHTGKGRLLLESLDRSSRESLPVQFEDSTAEIDVKVVLKQVGARAANVIKTLNYKVEMLA